MEGELLGSSSAEPQSQSDQQEKTFTEVFWDSFPFYINAGMTPEQYWDGDVEYAKGFRSAYWKRVEYENEMAWLHGYYVYAALGAIMPATSVKFKNRKFENYPEKPIAITKESAKREEADKQIKTFNKGMDYLKMFMAGHNKKYETE